jgi:hypothetical protein
MRARQLAEGLLTARCGSLEDKEEAARRFVLAATGEEAPCRYAFVVLRGLLEAAGHLAAPELCRGLAWRPFVESFTYACASLR